MSRTLTYPSRWQTTAGLTARRDDQSWSRVSQRHPYPYFSAWAPSVLTIFLSSSIYCNHTAFCSLNPPLITPPNFSYAASQQQYTGDKSRQWPWQNKLHRRVLSPDSRIVSRVPLYAVDSSSSGATVAFTSDSVTIHILSFYIAAVYLKNLSY